MLSTRRGLLAGALGAAGLAAAPRDARAQEARSIEIATAGVTGIYYPAGGAICRLVNRGRRSHGIRCAFASTAGSAYNIEKLRTGGIAFAIVQSDAQHAAFAGSGPLFGGRPFEGLRAVLSLHPEPFTVLARADAGIASFRDLEGKRVNIGEPGSGQRVTTEVLLQELGWQRGSFAGVTELRATEQSQALADGTVDAVFFTIGHPNGAIQEATTTAGARLVPVEGPRIDALVAARPYYDHVVIPGGLYANNPDDVRTFGVRATLVATARVPDAVVHEVVKAVFEDLGALGRLHPALAGLKPRAMARAGLTVPLHPGAEGYFRSVGLL